MDPHIFAYKYVIYSQYAWIFKTCNKLTDDNMVHISWKSHKDTPHWTKKLVRVGSNFGVFGSKSPNVYRSLQNLTRRRSKAPSTLPNFAKYRSMCGKKTEKLAPWVTWYNRKCRGAVWCTKKWVFRFCLKVVTNSYSGTSADGARGTESLCRSRTCHHDIDGMSIKK